MQSVVEGPSYFTNTWNVVRVASCAFFWMGVHVVLAHEAMCIEEPSKCKKEKSWDEGESMYYSASLFFMWLRMLHLLAVHQDLGPLVIVFRRMVRDFMTFGGIWAVLLLAFSCAMQGTGLNQPVENCEIGETHKMNCWRSWWLIRTYYQSFGQPFFEELTNDAANEVTIFMWPIMNLMMVNLLIAMMNSTYTEVKEQAKLEWMIEMFHIAKEYRSPSRLNVFMLVWDILLFIWPRKEINTRMKKLLETPGVGLFGWYEDTRFKFKKFQCGDLPAIEITDQIKTLRAQARPSPPREHPAAAAEGTRLANAPRALPRARCRYARTGGRAAAAGAARGGGGGGGGVGQGGGAQGQGRWGQGGLRRTSGGAQGAQAALVVRAPAHRRCAAPLRARVVVLI